MPVVEELDMAVPVLPCVDGPEELPILVAIRRSIHSCWAAVKVEGIDSSSSPCSSIFLGDFHKNYCGEANYTVFTIASHVLGCSKAHAHSTIGDWPGPSLH